MSRNREADISEGVLIIKKMFKFGFIRFCYWKQTIYFFDQIVLFALASNGFKHPMMEQQDKDLSDSTIEDFLG